MAENLRPSNILLLDRLYLILSGDSFYREKFLVYLGSTQDIVLQNNCCSDITMLSEKVILYETAFMGSRLGIQGSGLKCPRNTRKHKYGSVGQVLYSMLDVERSMFDFHLFQIYFNDLIN